MKSHLDLHGWAAERCYWPALSLRPNQPIVHDGQAWFHLIVPGLASPAAAGPLPFIAKVLQRRLNP